MENVSKELIKERLDVVSSSLPFDKILLIEDPTDLYYLTGLKLSKGVLIIGKKPILCVDGRYTLVAKHSFPYQVASFEELEGIVKEKKPKTVYFDGDKTPYTRYESLKKHLNQEAILEAEHYPLKTLREIKSIHEIALLKKSALINQKALQKAFSFLKEGVTEQEIAKKFMIAALELGAEKTAFDPIIAFGENTALPHHRASIRKLKKHDPVLMDVGIVYQGYASDMTRTCFFHEGSKELMDLRSKVISLQQQILDFVKPGITTKDLADFAKKEIESMGPYKMVHSLGHGLGLEVHEFPRLSLKAEEETILKPGMVITIEPGIYIEGVGGFREEDTVVVTEKGFKNFYKNFEFATVKV